MKQIKVSGADVIKAVGQEAAKTVIASLMCGENIRDFSEPLTRKRLAISNASLLVFFIKAAQQPDLLKKLPAKVVKEIHKTKRSSKEMVVLQWLLGTTNKGFQNILRDDPKNIATYIKGTETSLGIAIDDVVAEFGELRGALSVGPDDINIDWLLVLRLLGAVGAQTLAIRGADKSMYGKLFERLLLGSVLSMLGFEMISQSKTGQETQNVFWLSDRRHKRESDATVLLKPGLGIRFDIGFIGPGNTEISLDKVSRFEKYMELGQENHFIHTFIIVDRIGAKSSITDLAKNIDGTIIQMSMAYWPRLLAQEIQRKTGQGNPILQVPDDKFMDFVYKKMNHIDLRQFV